MILLSLSFILNLSLIFHHEGFLTSPMVSASTSSAFTSFFLFFHSTWLSGLTKQTVRAATSSKLGISPL